VSPVWKPDDSLLVRGKGGSKGAQRIEAALQKHKVSSAKRVITSRDARMNDVKKTLKRPRASMPPGVEQWQLPVTLGSRHAVLCFSGRMKPGAKVPAHAHKNDLFRVVISGTLKYRGKTLKAGDWMYVPAGQTYSLQAGPKGCVTFYHHG
jgi:mannose-6-phosphate isomerase-like protein (cupin superfamily)